MRIYPRLLAVLSGVAANCRKPWIIAACALALSSLGLSTPARAQCVGLGTSTVTCPSSTYPNGISASQPVAATTSPLNVTLKSGVNVTGLAAPTANAVDIFNQSTSPTNTLVVMENGATINVTGANAGLHLQIGAQPGQPAAQTGGDATVMAAGTIEVQQSGTGEGFRQDAIGVFTGRDGASASVFYTGPSRLLKKSSSPGRGERMESKDPPF
jgi:hypothetical protein